MILSNLCSLMEAAILSITPSQLAELRQRSPKAGQICQSLKRDIDKPFSFPEQIRRLYPAHAAESGPAHFQQDAGGLFFHFKAGGYFLENIG